MIIAELTGLRLVVPLLSEDELPCPGHNLHNRARQIGSPAEFLWNYFNGVVKVPDHYLLEAQRGGPLFQIADCHHIKVMLPDGRG